MTHDRPKSTSVQEEEPCINGSQKRKNSLIGCLLITKIWILELREEKYVVVTKL